MGRWVNAEPATDFAALEDLGLLRIFAAFEATALDVFSLLDIVVSFRRSLKKIGRGDLSPLKLFGFIFNPDDKALVSIISRINVLPVTELFASSEPWCISGSFEGIFHRIILLLVLKRRLVSNFRKDYI